jgi:hypothetical protein
VLFADNAWLLQLSLQLVPYVNTWRNARPASAVPGHRQVYPLCRVGPHTVAWPTGGLTRRSTPTVPHSRHGGGGISPYRLMLWQTTVHESPYSLLFALPRLGRPGSLRPLRLTSVGEISEVPPDWTHASLRLHQNPIKQGKISFGHLFLLPFRCKLYLIVKSFLFLSLSLSSLASFLLHIIAIY